MDIKYKDEQVRTIINLLNKMTLSGINNANILLNIVEILNNPITDEVTEKDIVVDEK